MSISEVDRPTKVQLKSGYGVFVLSPDEVQFRTGLMSGVACVVSDPERRGLLGSVVERLFSPEGRLPRPWNEAEIELLEEVLPELQENGIIEAENAPPSSGVASKSRRAFLTKSLEDARIAIIGHGALGTAVRSLLASTPCQEVSVFRSSSVAETVGGVESSETTRGAGQPFPRPRGATEWRAALSGHDWVVAAQDSFEPEELGALNEAALSLSLPWSLVCFDGYEGWVGPTFVPRQTACFDCFRRRLFAGAEAPKHLFMNPSLKVHRVPTSYSAGPETAAWVSLITSIFALELISALQGRSFTFSEMLIVHRLNLTFQRETVLRLPRCPSCSPSRGAPAQNVFAHMLSTRQAREPK